jgi:uncharacterized membrane protein YeaQ/YmgE (transglycosylase-associated protein family)
MAIPLGIAGAVLGGLIGAWLTGSANGFDYLSTLMAIIGSLIVSFSYRAYAMRAME